MSFVLITLTLNPKLLKLFYSSAENHISSQASPILSQEIQTLAILMVLTLENNWTFFSTDKTQPVLNWSSNRYFADIY